MPTHAMDAATDTPQDRRFYAFTGVLSTLALAFIGYILMVHRGGGGGRDLSFLPAVNAGLNATAATLLMAGWVAVRRKNTVLHRYLMLGAFAASSVFLVGYLTYHYAHGDTRYPLGAPMRGAYLALLASHVILSIPVVPMALVALYFAAQKRFERHRRVTRWLAPIWLYVSVTGVLVFAMLRHAVG